MPTTYTTNLKLAKPATGDLSGTWGTTVNDNVTSMIEEAITGRAALSTWVANAQTITTANGTTASGRCLLLDLSGTLSATGTLTVPSANKFFVVRNGTTGGYAVTVTMGSGTTVSVANGETVMVYVDGTNVKVAITTVSKADTATTVTTNANLTGHITSTGNAAILGSFSLAQLNTAISDADVSTGGGTATGTNTGDQTNISGNAATVTTNANLTGDVTSVGNAVTLTNASVIAKVLTGYASAPGVVAATDSILAAINKLNGNNNRPVWSIKTTTYTAVAGDYIQANTTSAAFTIILPASPSANDQVCIADYAGTFGTNNLTLARNALKIMSLAEDMTVSTANVSLTLSYIDATRGWALT